MKQMKSLSVFGVLILAVFFQTARANASDVNMSDEILLYVNQYRAQHGLSKLSMNPVVAEQAQRHSQDMATHALPFGHDGFGSRIQHMHEGVANSSSGAENVAYNYKTARIVVDGWIKSPGHRQNILGHYNVTGIGIARDKAGKIYYTQLFLQAGPAVAVRKVGGAHHHSAVRLSGTFIHGHHAYS